MWLTYGAGLAAIPFIARVITRIRFDRKARREADLPLFDLVALEVATTPKPGGDDDGDVLAEVRETLTHLNRRMYAQDVWRLPDNLCAYYHNLPSAQKPTMERGICRLIGTDDRWLILIGATTAGKLHLQSSLPYLCHVRDHGDRVQPRLGDTTAPEEQFLAQINDAIAQVNREIDVG